MSWTRVSGASVLVALVVLVTGVADAENIDPDDDGSQFAWAENVGWWNAEPSGDGGPGVQVGDAELSGWIWAENVGWISLSCKNTLSCATHDYGVIHDGNGNLSGFAWSENVGWIHFAPATSGVSIDPQTGEFHGAAWAENVGWIRFNCADTGSCGTVDYRVRSAWVCDPPPPAPTGSPVLGVDRGATGDVLSWGEVSGATAYDVVHGDLICLRAAGDFAACTIGCLDGDRTVRSLRHDAPLAPADGFWYLVRARNCGGRATYGSAQRDAGVPASGSDCP